MSVGDAQQGMLERSAFALVPFERVVVPPALDGRTGTNRAHGHPAQIAADTDLDAVKAWLAVFSDSPNTFRSYRREAERLLLWSYGALGKPLSSLVREDLRCYEAFLADPQPCERWCGPRASRDGDSWRPFQKPLGATSRRQVFAVLNSMFSYLTATGYLASNPILPTRRRRSATREHPSVERFLEPDLWRHVLRFIDLMPHATTRELARRERARYLFSLLHLLGPKVSEIACGTMGDFVERRGKWWWRASRRSEHGKLMPVSRDMMLALERYRTFLGLTAWPLLGERTPLVLNISGTRAVTANMVYRIAKEVLVQAAEQLQRIDACKALKLRHASTQWLRQGPRIGWAHDNDASEIRRYAKSMKSV